MTKMSELDYEVAKMNPNQPPHEVNMDTLRGQADGFRELANQTAALAREATEKLAQLQKERDEAVQRVKELEAENLQQRIRIDNEQEIINAADYARDQTLEKLAQSEADKSALREALNDLLRETNTIEVLGEWEAMGTNHSMRKKYRAKVDAVILKARQALSTSPVQKADVPDAEGVILKGRPCAHEAAEGVKTYGLDKQWRTVCKNCHMPMGITEAPPEIKFRESLKGRESSPGDGR